MDALGDLLAPHSENLAKFAGTVTCLQFLSVVFLLNDIRKQGTSDTYPPDPFIGGVVLTVLSLKLGTLMGDAAMIKVNIIGFAINIIFMSIFYWYASGEARTKIWSRIGIGAAFSMACLAYSNFEDPEKIEFRFGLIITGILLYLVGSPLLNLNKIIESKSTVGMPFPLILSGTIVSASWTLYGISIYNTVVTYQNLLMLFLSSIQLSLFAIYPNTPPNKAPSVTHSPSTLEHKISKLKTPIPSTSSFSKKEN